MKISNLIVATIALVIANAIIILKDDIVYLRIARFITVTLFFLFPLLKGKFKNKSLLLAFANLIIADFCMVFYDIPIFSQLKFLFSAIACMFLLSNLITKIDFSKLNSFSVLFASVVLICTVFVLTNALGMAGNKLHGFSHEILFSIYGITLILFLVASVIYYQIETSFMSNVLLGMAVLFMLSDVCLVIAFYLNKFHVFQFANVFYFIGVSLLVIFSSKNIEWKPLKKSLF